jgi:methylenetetrahydrofolate dehydrogenase (NADP+) / methenyltetrahydrofolate cyclohydrolase
VYRQEVPRRSRTIVVSFRPSYRASAHPESRPASGPCLGFSRRLESPRFAVGRRRPTEVLRGGIASSSSAKRVEGKPIAERLREEVRAEARALAAAGVVPHLVAVQVGDHAESAAYIESQRRQAGRVDIRFTSRRLPARASLDDVRAELRTSNADRSVHGIFVPLPLPDGLDSAAVQAAIDPEKDVEGVTPVSLGRVLAGRPANVPCTAAAVLEVLDSENVAVRGAEVVVVGHSTIVGKPLALLLLDRLATVTVCHVGTRDLALHTRRAEILVVAVGKPGLVTADMIRPGAFVLDVGTTIVRGADGQSKLVGDVEPEGAARVASRFTPVPGGVGAVTVAILLRNTVRAAARSAASR